jgi:hypothetical protein
MFFIMLFFKKSLNLIKTAIRTCLTANQHIQQRIEPFDR